MSEVKQFLDGCSAFPEGVNSGAAPVLLPRTQLAAARNATMRGNFATDRPPYRKIAIDYGGDLALQTNIETGLWQGGCYFNPDSGAESLMAQISGRLFQFTISDNIATAGDRSIVGDLNSDSAPQAWMWQAEKWVIVNDGLALPIFFDGNASRRSAGNAFGTSGLLNTIAGPFTIPDVGVAVTVTFGTPYAGPFNVPVKITTGANGSTSGIFKIISSNVIAQSNAITLKNLFTGYSGILGLGNPVYVKPSNVGFLASAVTQTFSSSGTTATLSLTTPTAPAVGALLTIVNKVWLVTSVINSSQFNVRPTNGTTLPITVTFPASSEVVRYNDTTPVRQIATLSASWTIPSAGSGSTAYLSLPYTDPINGYVIINNKKFQVTAVATVAASATVTIVNLTATAGASWTTSSVYAISELPAGRMGAYGLGRNWYSLTDGRRFQAGDTVGSSVSGTIEYGYRDAVLRVSENSFLNGGGNFVIPGNVGEIRAMKFAATADTALGQGPLQVFTQDIVFSCQSPVDRTKWQDVQSPILTQGIISNGAQGQDGVVADNSDLIFRSKDGIRSQILAKRDFQAWGNVPLSFEVSPTMGTDLPGLLPFVSAIVFDNRMLMTAGSVAGPQGVYFTNLIALNHDPISSIQGKAPSIYDGVWSGLNVLQLMRGSFAGVERAFAFTYNTTTSIIELYELLPTGTLHLDNGTDQIVWEIETPVFNFGQNDPSKRDYKDLIDGEISVQELSGNVTFEAFYRPDFEPNWQPWYKWTVTSGATYDTRMGLGTPAAVNSPLNKVLYRNGYSFQVKLRITGHAKIMEINVAANLLPELKFAPQFPRAP